MRIDALKIWGFKNLDNFEINFDETQLTNVLIGHNGTGKSNLIEALIIIFRSLDLAEAPLFKYEIEYKCRGRSFRVSADPCSKPHTLIKVDGKEISNTQFVKGKDLHLPSHVFAYYSGPSSRLEEHFEKHLKRFHDELLAINLNQTQPPLRPFFYARLFHSQFVLLSYFSFTDVKSNAFLRRYFGIKELESVLFVLKKPDWARTSSGDPRFWGARGIVSKFLDEMYACALAPFKHVESNTKEYIYLYIKDLDRLQKLAKKYSNNKNFFKALESMGISDLLAETRIKVKMEKGHEVTFKELSEGEQQLLTVLGLLKFTKDDEALFLLDEPDTHLNPAWKLGYLGLLNNIVGKSKTSHVILSTHDPLVIGGLNKEQVKIFYKEDKTNNILTKSPEIDPRGMGVAGLLTSEVFGLSTTLDSETQRKLDKKRVLALKPKRTVKDNTELRKLADELSELGFARTTRDPLYDKFINAVITHNEFKQQVLTPATRKKQDKIAEDIIDELLKAKK